MSKVNEYDRLYEQYNNKSDEELLNIINSNDDYTDIAKKVASDVLNSDRTEYYNKQKKELKNTTNKQETISNDEILKRMYFEIHTIKNIMIFFAILTILALVYSFYAIYIALPNIL